MSSNSREARLLVEGPVLGRSHLVLAPFGELCHPIPVKSAYLHFFMRNCF